MTIERQAEAKGGRVKIGMTGKFLLFKYYGAEGNAQALPMSTGRASLKPYQSQ